MVALYVFDSAASGAAAESLSLKEMHAIFAAVDEIQADAPPRPKGGGDTAGIAANKAHMLRLRSLEGTYASGSQAQKYHAAYVKALKKCKGEAHRKACFASARRAPSP